MKSQYKRLVVAPRQITFPSNYRSLKGVVLHNRQAKKEAEEGNSGKQCTYCSSPVQENGGDQQNYSEAAVQVGGHPRAEVALQAGRGRGAPRAVPQAERGGRGGQTRQNAFQASTSTLTLSLILMQLIVEH